MDIGGYVMEKNKNVFVKVIVAIFVLALVVGLVICGLKYFNKDNASKDGVITKSDQHTKMFSASIDNWGLTDASEDYWSSSYWRVYYDGIVEYYEKYNLSGETTHVTWELSDEEFSELSDIFRGRFREVDEGTSAEDGEVWSMTYYGKNEEKIHHFFGYIYNITVLEEIVDILDSDERDKVEKGEYEPPVEDIDEPSNPETPDDDLYDTGAWDSIGVRVDEYQITINAINSGHPSPGDYDRDVIFATYFDWDSLDSVTTSVDMEYVFYPESINEKYESLDEFEKTTIDGKEYYYQLGGENNDKLYLYYINEYNDCSYMMIVLSLGSSFDNETGNKIENADINIEDLLGTELLEEAIDFEILMIEE